MHQFYYSVVLFPGLLIEYYNEKIIQAMDNIISKAIKVDSNTKFAKRGKFACVCVEVNLYQALVPKIIL